MVSEDVADFIAVFHKVTGSGQYDRNKVEKPVDAIFDFLSNTSEPNIVVKNTKITFAIIEIVPI